MRVTGIMIAFALCAAALDVSVAQTNDTPALSSEAEISVLTVLPGNRLYSAFGHTAIRVRDNELGIDEVYNYGTFDFDTPNFYLKFMRGRLDYQLVVDSFGPVFATYFHEGRPIIEQHLDLDPGTLQEIFEFLEWNALPENRAYRYDFFFDNCSTRPRDVVESVVGEHLVFDESATLEQSYRGHILPYVADRPFTRFGMDLLLGMPSDRVASPRDEVFLPLRLFEALEYAGIEENGRLRPLVAHTDTLYWFEGADYFKASPPWPQIVFWALFGIAVIGTARAFRSGPGMRRGVVALDAIAFGLIGVTGLLMLFMWFGTEHTVTVQNFNLIWAWPLHIVAAGFLTFMPQAPVLRYYLVAACFGTALVLLGWPFWPQVMHPAVIPILLLIVLRSGFLAYSLRDRRSIALKT